MASISIAPAGFSSLRLSANMSLTSSGFLSNSLLVRSFSLHLIVSSSIFRLKTLPKKGRNRRDFGCYRIRIGYRARHFPRLQLLYRYPTSNYRGERDHLGDQWLGQQSMPRYDPYVWQGNHGVPVRHKQMISGPRQTLDEVISFNMSPFLRSCCSFGVFGGQHTFEYQANGCP